MLSVANPGQLATLKRSQQRKCLAYQGQILRVFLLQGCILGFIGSTIGAAMGGGALAPTASNPAPVAQRPAQGTRIVDGPFPRRTVIKVINGVRRNSGSSDDPISHFELRKRGQIWTAS